MRPGSTAPLTLPGGSDTWLARSFGDVHGALGWIDDPAGQRAQPPFVDRGPLDPIMDYTITFEARIVSGAHAIQGALMSRTQRPQVLITGPEVDLQREVIIDSRGRRVDQAYVDEALAEVEEDVRRRAGRPSLSGTSEHSPHVTFRVTPEMKARAEAAALEQGITVSALARLAFERYLSV